MIIIKKIFIAGPLAIKSLDSPVIKKLTDIKNDGNMVYVGDANGVDKLIQEFYHNIHYKNVKVYANEGKPRNNLGNWEIVSISADKKLKGFEYYSQKDIAMARDSDYGFMIWNGKSRGTLNNMINLRKEKKDILLYFTPSRTTYFLNEDLKLDNIVMNCEDKTIKIYKSLLRKKKDKQTICETTNNTEQLKLNLYSTKRN